MKKNTNNTSCSNHSLIRVFLVLVSGLWLTGCNDAEQQQYQPRFSSTPVNTQTIYRFGIHPLHNPHRLYEIFDPIMDLLNRKIPAATFKLEASRNYAAYDDKLYSRQFHFALPNPFQTINSLSHGYRVFGKMADDENFRGIILVRKDSNIETPKDLKGKAVSFPAPTALAATMMPQYYLQQHGLRVMQDLDIRYVGSQESSIMNVYLGNTSAAATWPPPWHALSKERPKLAEALVVKWQTPSLPNNGLVVRDDIPETIVQQVAEVFFQLHTRKDGQYILERMELSRFEPATNATYQPVIEFVEKFHQQVRPIK